MDSSILFYVLLFFVAFLYASVGHGGASGYLALMAIFGIAPDVMKPTALLLNLFVSLTSFIQFYRGQHFKWKLFLPFAIASIPMAYVGGLVTVDAVIRTVPLRSPDVPSATIAASARERSALATGS